MRLSLILLVLLAFALAVEAQELSYNQPVTGQVRAGSQAIYRFNAQDGEMLSFIVRSTSPTLDTVLTLRDLNGNTLLTNDDYNFPTSRDSLIEGFTTAYTGAYSLVVTGFGNSAGSFELTMLPGFSRLSLRDTFETASGWQSADTGSISPAQISSRNGIITLSQEGVNQAAIAIGLQPSRPIYYIQAEITAISANPSWRVGLVFKYQNPQNYYQVLLNQQGSWRFDKQQNGQNTVIRNWTPHPAIRAGQTAFILGILVNQTGYDIFYNNQYVGTVEDASLDSGAIGISLTTADALNSRVSVSFDQILITEPTLVANQPVFPTQLVDTGSNRTVRELEHRLVIPAGGEMLFSIPEAFAQNVTAGVSRFAIGNQQVTNFVLSADVAWTRNRDVLNGCGLVIRDLGEQNVYVLAYVDSQGGYGMSYRVNESFAENYFNNQVELGQPPYRLLVIANGDKVHFYLNKQHVHTLNSPVREGRIAQAVVNFQENNTACRYTNIWLWRLDD